MFNKVKVSVISVVTTIMSSGAIAHAGHEHSDASSGLIHIAWLAPVLIAAVFVSYLVRKNKINNADK